MIKEVLLDEEKELVRKFLKDYKLEMDKVEKTYYSLDDDDQINGTISYDGNIIKCLAVSSDTRSENLASSLVSKVLSEFQSLKIYSYKVFTKPIYKKIFESLGFRPLVQDDYFVYLEGGIDGIEKEIKDLKTRIEFSLGPINEDSDIGCCVINANPMTLGHEYLIEEISKRHDKVIVFVVEEDKSFYRFEERMSMVYLTCQRLDNVVVVPSGTYIVSSLTFPSYFLSSDDVARERVMVDGLIFEKYFMKELFIKKRYVGTEKKEKMVYYNKILKDILKERLEILDRFEYDGEIVSASVVRSLVNKGKIDEAMKYIPRSIQSLFKIITVNKSE